MRGSSVRFMKPVMRAGAGVALVAAPVISTAVPASAYTSPVLTNMSGQWEAGSGMYLQYWRDSTSGNAHHPAWSHGVRVRSQKVGRQLLVGRAGPGRTRACGPVRRAPA